MFSKQRAPRNKPFDDEIAEMEQKTARLTVLIDPTKKDAFEQLCASQDVTPSQVVRQLIREYLEKHGVTYANQAQNSNGNHE
ncbi:ribbon-helix-helix protein, CopG family [Cellvibrio sp. PSBB006]|uniref:ribbon-helix-helix protein, CopG family n=1 Tax=Cellvibrio sp. PSBB006 TaxID=1987723 RepID=UPI001E465FA7|nr:ribbon-helix-helix protein, CopG family [Cellvibrio sp. PSBB006]